MPELKRVPQAGKMNRDFHERILPPGEYREALNVNIGRSETSEVGTVENLLGNELVGALTVDLGGKTAKTIGSYRDNGNERIYYFVTTNDRFDESNADDEIHLVMEYDQLSGATRSLVSSNSLNFHKNFTITGVNLVDELLFWTDNRNEPRKINVDRARQDNTFYSSDDLMAVAKYSPFESASIVGVSETDTDGSEIDSNFLQDKLPRFSYRWRFNDGEFSVLAPFTPIVFSRLGGSEVVGEEESDAGEIPTFINAVKSVQLQTPTPSGFGITSVELIYKESTSQTLYIVEDKQVTTEETITFDYVSQDPFRTVPPSQLTRVSDAIPKVAKSQEVAGGRIVYGNYLQNFNLPTVDFAVSVQTDTEESNLPNFSVKSRRTYQVGIVLSDRYGRVTPVILSNSGGDTIFVNPLEGPDAFQGLTVTFDDVSQLSDFYSYKIVVKQREQEYYNWISIGTLNGGVERFGDSINKIPRDTTAEDPGNATISPVDTRVYPKVTNGSNDSTGSLIKVQQIVIRTGDAIVPGSPDSGLVVYETEPVISELNIFFETSTGGIISELASDVAINVSFYNCYILKTSAFHIEANRLRVGFNEPFFDIGVRAHVVNEDYSGEERRSNTLIHSSGFLNSRTGLNQLNQFNEAEGGITLSLDPSDGSIQKLYAEDTQLIIWQEDKVSRSPIDKDFIYSAEGGAVPVTSNTQYLGTIAPYAGEYGISRNPESFAIYGTQKYFTDRNRGVVLRLSQDGLSEINRAGMSDFFRDALRTSTEIIGSFSEYHNAYNLTIIGEGYDRNEDTNVATADRGYFTVGYEDDTRGWVTFKSFRQESGLTLNNRYYTFSGGQLWMHNSETASRNNFYNGGINESYVDFIFNDSPSVVKDFKTLGYEGRAGWVCDYIQTDIDTEGTPPTTETRYVNVSLDVTGSVSNIIFSGERIAQVISGEQTTFIVVVEPISLQYELDDLADVTLSIGGVEIVGDDKRINDGKIYFRINRIAVEDDTITATLGGNGAGLSFTVSLLTVNIFAGSIPNAELVGSVSRPFNNAGDTSFEVDINPDPDYYIEAGEITVNADALSSFSNGDVEEVLVGDDVRFLIPITVPEIAGSASITLSGSPTLKPLLTWVLTENLNINDVLTPSNSDELFMYRRSPRETDDTKESVLVLTPNETTEIALEDSFTLNTDGNFTEIGDVSIGEFQSNLTWTLRSDITTSDLTSTVTPVGSFTDATLSDTQGYESPVVGSLDVPDRTFTSTGNVPVELLVEYPQGAEFITGISSDEINPGDQPITYSIGDNLSGAQRQAVITVSPAYERLTGVTPVVFTITQA